MGGSDRASEGPMIGGKTNEDRDTDRSHDGLRHVINDLYVDHRSTSVLLVVKMIQEQTTNDRAGNQLKKEAGASPDVKTDEEPCPEDDRIEEEPDALPIVMKDGSCTPKMWFNTWRYRLTMLCPMPKLRLTIFR